MPRVLLHTTKKNQQIFAFFGFFFPWYPTGSHRILTRYHGKKSKKWYVRFWKMRLVHMQGVLALEMPHSFLPLSGSESMYTTSLGRGFYVKALDTNVVQVFN
jgi:hypothetical protein